MAELKPDLLLVPYGYAEKEENWPGHAAEFHNIVKKTAVKTAAAVIGTNLVGQIIKGQWASRVYGGQSIALDKTGKIIALAKDRDRDIKLVSLTAAK